MKPNGSKYNTNQIGKSSLSGFFLSAILSRIVLSAQNETNSLNTLDKRCDLLAELDLNRAYKTIFNKRTVRMTTDWAQATFNSFIVGSSAINCLKIRNGRHERKNYRFVNFYTSIP